MQFHSRDYFLVFFKFVKIFWNIADLQRCVNFCYTAVIQVDIYIFFSIAAYHRILNILPCLRSRILLLSWLCSFLPFYMVAIIT